MLLSAEQRGLFPSTAARIPAPVSLPCCSWAPSPNHPRSPAPCRCRHRSRRRCDPSAGPPRIGRSPRGPWPPRTWPPSRCATASDATGSPSRCRCPRWAPGCPKPRAAERWTAGHPGRPRRCHGGAPVPGLSGRCRRNCGDPHGDPPDNFMDKIWLKRVKTGTFMENLLGKWTKTRDQKLAKEQQ